VHCVYIGEGERSGEGAAGGGLLTWEDGVSTQHQVADGRGAVGKHAGEGGAVGASRATQEVLVRQGGADELELKGYTGGGGGGSW
jgi:hypothetical protein